VVEGEEVPGVRHGDGRRLCAGMARDLRFSGVCRFFRPRLGLNIRLGREIAIAPLVFYERIFVLLQDQCVVLPCLSNLHSVNDYEYNN
jgi:hypothetical protein